MLVHKKRVEHNAIMVGTRTAELDNPSLTVRNWQGRSPVRIVTDPVRTGQVVLADVCGTGVDVVATRNL